MPRIATGTSSSPCTASDPPPCAAQCACCVLGAVRGAALKKPVIAVCPPAAVRFRLTFFHRPKLPQKPPCGCGLGRKTRSAFFTPILASAFFTRSLRVFFLTQFYAFFYLPTVRVFYSDPPPRFFAAFLARFFLNAFFSFLAACGRLRLSCVVVWCNNPGLA